MRINVKIGANIYQIEIMAIFENNTIAFKSELIGTTMSTFDYRKSYIGNSMEESLIKISQELTRAWEELLGS